MIALPFPRVLLGLKVLQHLLEDPFSRFGYVCFPSRKHDASINIVRAGGKRREDPASTAWFVSPSLAGTGRCRKLRVRSVRPESGSAPPMFPTPLEIMQAGPGSGCASMARSSRAVDSPCQSRSSASRRVRCGDRPAASTASSTGRHRSRKWRPMLAEGLPPPERSLPPGRRGSPRSSD